MQILKHSFSTFSIILLITTILTEAALPQSGRGRPRVPQPASPTEQPQPQPVIVPATAAVTGQEQLGTSSRFALRNGMTVVISEQHADALAAAVAIFKTGLAANPGPSSALARLVQQLMLDGTVPRPGRRAIAELRSLGALIDAHALYDGASFSVVAPSDKINKAIAVLADILQNPSFDEKTLAGAVRRVAAVNNPARARYPNPPMFTTRPFSSDRECCSIDDDPAVYSMARAAELALNSGAEWNHEALRSITRDQIVEYYRSHYRPENLIVSIAGDVPTFNTLVEIQQLFGAFGAKPELPAEPDKAPVTKSKTAPVASNAGTPRSSAIKQTPAKAGDAEPEKPRAPLPSLTVNQDNLRYIAERADITQTIVSTAFHAPGAESKELPAIEMLAAIIGLGRGSRLSRSLIDVQLAANRIESNYTAITGAGLLTIQLWPAFDSREGSSIDRAESAMFKELDRLRREIPSEGEMARARAVLEKGIVDQSRGYLARAMMIARAEAGGAGYRALFDYRTRIRAVRAEDVQKAAARYLTLANTSVYEYEPFGAAARTFDANTFSTTVNAWAPGLAQPVDAGSIRPAEANSVLPPVSQGAERSPERQAMIESVQALPVKDFSTLNGPRALVREDHSQQKVTVAVLFQGGRLSEDPTTSGTTELMLRSILYGTPRRTYWQMTQELEQLGADVQIVIESDFFGFNLSVLSRNADRALKLLRDSIEEPAFRDDDVGRAKLGHIASIRDDHDSSFMRSRDLLQETLFPGHPYSLAPHGREEVISALTPEKLREWHGRTVKRQLPVAIVVGDTDGSALVSSQIAEGFKRRDVDSTIQVKRQQPAAVQEKIEQRRIEHSRIAIGFTGPAAQSADLTVAHIVESAMNGEGGRLIEELRDKDNLIAAAEFSVDAMFAEGALYVRAAAAADNEQRARTALLAQIERLSRGDLSAAELASAKSLAVTSRAARLQSQSQHALEYARAIFNQRQASDVDGFTDKVSIVTGEDVKRVASQYFKPASARFAIVRSTPRPPTVKPN